MVVYNVHMRLQHLLFIAERTSKEILYSGSSSYVVVKVNIRTLQWRLRDKSPSYLFFASILHLSLRPASTPSYCQRKQSALRGSLGFWVKVTQT